MAAGSMILEQFQTRTTVMEAAPPDLAGTVPARVVGHGTAHALVARTETGFSLGYEGEAEIPALCKCFRKITRAAV